MSILDRKPKKYSTSDLFWEPSAAPSDGAIGDINTMKLDPSHLGMAQDVIIDSNGILRSRGAVASITSDTFASFGPLAAIQTITAVGGTPTNNTALLMADSTTTGPYLYGTTATALTGFAAKLTVDGYTATAQAFMNTASGGWNGNAIRQSGNKGGIFCFQSWFQGRSNAGSFVWGGNATVTSLTTAGTAASTIGSTAIVGVGTAWTTALEGCYLYITSGGTPKLVGLVDRVTSTTALVLKRGAIFTAAAAVPNFVTSRRTALRVYKGRITTNTGSAVVVGANTKFATSGPNGTGTAFLTTAGSCNTLFRASDGAFVGTVTSVQNDTTLTLTGNAAIAMTNESYYLDSTLQTYAANNVQTPYFAATCAEYFSNRYWYGGIVANDWVSGMATFDPSNQLYAYNGQNSVAFSALGEPEFLDLDPVSGDIINIPPGPNADSVRGLKATRGGLVVFRTYDTSLITGYSPDTFRLIKIVDDGVTSSSVLKTYKDGVIWAGNRSVWYFDGTRVIDLLSNKLARFYRRTTTPTQVGTGLVDNYFMVSYAINTSYRTWPYKNTTKQADYVTMVINMENGSVTFFTNLYVYNSFVAAPLSSSVSSSPVILTGTTKSPLGATGFLVNGSKIFLDSSVAADNFDAITGAATFTSGTQIGPDVMFETVKLSLGNAARMKFWKMLLMNYSSDVSMTASFIGTNDTTLDFPSIGTGTAGTVTFPVSSNIGILKRIKFLVRTPALMIRVYQTATASATSQRYKLLWYTVGGKWMREGRQM